MVALGFAVVYRVTGVVNLSQGAFCVLGAMAMYFFQTVLQWPLPLALLAAVASTVAGVTAIGAVSFVPAVSTLPGSGTLMLTAGLLTFFQGFVLVVWGSQPYALPPFSGEAPINLLGIRLPSQGLWLVAACAVMVLGFWYLLQRTTFGRALRACAENATAAQLMGIDVRGMMRASIALAASIGALQRHPHRTDHVTAIRHRKLLHQLRFRRGGDRRDGQFCRSDRRRTGAWRRLPTRPPPMCHRCSPTRWRWSCCSP